MGQNALGLAQTRPAPDGWRELHTCTAEELLERGWTQIRDGWAHWSLPGLLYTLRQAQQCEHVKESRAFAETQHDHAKES